VLTVLEWKVAIYRLLQGAVFDDRAVKAMTMAYDAALVDLGLPNRTERHGGRKPSGNRYGSQSV